MQTAAMTGMTRKLEAVFVATAVAVLAAYAFMSADSGGGDSAETLASPATRFTDADPSRLPALNSYQTPVPTY
jgi:hypothetical protein